MIACADVEIQQSRPLCAVPDDEIIRAIDVKPTLPARAVIAVDARSDASRQNSGKSVSGTGVLRDVSAAPGLDAVATIGACRAIKHLAAGRDKNPVCAVAVGGAIHHGTASTRRYAVGGILESGRALHCAADSHDNSLAAVARGRAVNHPTPVAGRYTVEHVRASGATLKEAASAHSQTNAAIARSIQVTQLAVHRG